MVDWRLTIALAGALALAGCDGDDGVDGPAGGDTDADDGSEPDDPDDGGDDDDDDDDDDGDDDDDDDGAADGADDGSEALSFETDVAPILAQSCSCHSGGSPSAGLDLSPEAAYAALVGVMSAAGIPFVTPGDSGQSYLVNKLDGSHADVGGSGAKMPMGGELPGEQIDTIADWIDAGAPE